MGARQLIDEQVAELIRSIHLPDNWEPIVRQMLDNQGERRFWIERLEAQENNCDLEEDLGQVSNGVEIDTHFFN